MTERRASKQREGQVRRPDGRGLPAAFRDRREARVAAESVGRETADGGGGVSDFYGFVALHSDWAGARLAGTRL